MSVFLSVRRSVKIAVQFAVSVVVLAYVPSVMANTSYTLVDYPAFDQGFTVGTIVTDGNFGVLTGADILGGDIQGFQIDGAYGVFTATATSITVASDQFLVIGTPILNPTAPLSMQTWLEIDWRDPNPRTFGSGQYVYPPDSYSGGYGYIAEYVMNGFTVPADTIDAAGGLGGEPWVVAVPEPSTLALLGIGAISLLGYAWRRRKAV